MSDLTRVVSGRIVPVAGEWKIDPGHSSIAFTTRHLFTRLRGRFRDVVGAITIADDVAASHVEVTIDAGSIDTVNTKIDEALRGASYLDVEHHPTLAFTSTAVELTEHDEWLVSGELTIRGVTRPVELATRFLGAATSPLGGLQKLSLTATTSFRRSDYGIEGTYESPDTPGVLLVGDVVEVTLDIEADRVVG